MDAKNSLDTQTYLWGDWKHHFSINFLIWITPYRTNIWILLIYRQRSSDIHVARDSGFLWLLEPYDQITADCRFKIKTGLALKHSSLSIHPSSAKGNQMVKRDLHATINIVNVQIYVKRAIQSIKELKISKHF